MPHASNAIAAVATTDPILQLEAGKIAETGAISGAQAAWQATPMSFAQTLLHGVTATNDQLINAERLISAAATNEGVPLHHVIYTLEQARMEFELAMQVRSKLLDAYQQLVNMQI